MNKELLIEIATKHLVPLFSGASISDNVSKSTSSESCVAFVDPCTIALKVHKDDVYRVLLKRAQPFASPSEVAVPEIDVVKSFISVVGRMANELQNEDLRHDLLSTFQRRVVAKAISTNEAREEILLSCIDQLGMWADRLYEGRPISAAIGFRNVAVEDDSPSLEQVCREDFGAVVSNGHDTLLAFNFEGRFNSYQALNADQFDIAFCPIRQLPIANWTANDFKGRRVAMCLNRNGEILVFRDGRLLFARRSGSWHFLTHEPIFTQMGMPDDRSVRKAIYETALDASFARTGACLGVVSSGNASHWKSVVVSESDRLKDATSVKGRAVNRMIRGKKFYELDRRLRQELTSIDGATVISYRGEILAVGAILKIPGGSSGGGRLAAAKALGALGLGVKVSQDGGIVGYRSNKSNPVFQML